MLSILAPVLLSAPSLRDSGPSIISEIPHHRKSAQNGALKTSVKSNPTAAMALDREMMFGHGLILSTHCFTEQTPCQHLVECPDSYEI